MRMTEKEIMDQVMYAKKYGVDLVLLADDEEEIDICEAFALFESEVATEEAMFTEAVDARMVEKAKYSARRKADYYAKRRKLMAAQLQKSGLMVAEGSKAVHSRKPGYKRDKKPRDIMSKREVQEMINEALSAEAVEDFDPWRDDEAQWWWEDFKSTAERNPDGSYSCNRTVYDNCEDDDYYDYYDDDYYDDYDHLEESEWDNGYDTGYSDGMSYVEERVRKQIEAKLAGGVIEMFGYKLQVVPEMQMV